MSELFRPTDNYNARVLEALQNLSADVQALRVEVANIDSRLHTTQDVATANAGRQIELETRVSLLAATTVPLWLQIVVLVLLAAAILYLAASLRELSGVLHAL